MKLLEDKNYKIGGITCLRYDPSAHIILDIQISNPEDMVFMKRISDEMWMKVWGDDLYEYTPFIKCPDYLKWNN